MKLNRCWVVLTGAAAVLLALGSTAWAVSASLELAVDPALGVRGETVTIEAVASNLGGSDIAQATLFAPLPAGIDQWDAEVRLHPWDWEPFPANGLIAIGAIAAGTDTRIEIRLPIEQAAPASLVMTCQLLDIGGILAQQTLPLNVSPSVDAGPDLIADIGSAVEIREASASDGQDGLAVLEWSDHGAGGSFDNEAVLHPIYTPPEDSGLLELTLRGTDHSGATAEDSLRLRVNGKPAVDLGKDQAADEGTSIDFAEATVVDPDGWVAEYAWDDGEAGGRFVPSSSEANPQYVVPMLDGCEDDVITVTLTVLDDWGAASHDSVRVFVSNENLLPEVVALGDAQIESGMHGSLVGQATDPDGDIVHVRWRQLDGPSVALDGERDANRITFTAPDVAVPTVLRFEFTATDGCGAEAQALFDVRVLPCDTDSDGGVGVTESARLAVRMTVLDERGFPVDGSRSPIAGETMMIQLSISNLSEVPLHRLHATVSGREATRLMSDQLPAWSDTTGNLEWRIDASDLVPLLEFEAVVEATDPHGITHHASDRFAFAPADMTDRGASLRLETSTSRSAARVGEEIVLAFSISNRGPADLVGLSLMDDRLGWIELPSHMLEAGATVEVEATVTLQETDLPGPLTFEATARAFTNSGLEVQSSVAASVGLLPPDAGGGGATIWSAGSLQTGDAMPIVISEIAWAGTPNDPGAQWIELVNLGDIPVDLSGWSIRWHEKTGSGTPEDIKWQNIALSGTIDPLPQLQGIASGHELKFVESEKGVWRTFDFAWWGQGKSGTQGRGYFLLERGHDDVVRNVTADLIYGTASDARTYLPESGAAVFLVSARGEVVDSANAQSGSQGWTAGSAATCASMERVDLFGADYAENWQTHAGIFAFGVDADGRPLRATAGKPNCPSADEFLDAVRRTLPSSNATSLERMTISNLAHLNLASVQIMSAATVQPGGGGGSGSAAPEISTTRTGTDLTLELDLQGITPGSYFICISLSNGDALIIPLVVSGASPRES